MYSIINFFPSTFFSIDRDILILDEDKNKFYVHPNKEKQITFNLPKGTYYTKNKIMREQNFVPYVFFVSPFPLGFLNDLTGEEKNNPNKASIHRISKHIIADPKIVNHIYKPVRVFTIAHEIGHLIHFPKLSRTVTNYNMVKRELEQVEKDADKFARDFMLGNGYNPIQIKLAVNLILSHKERRLCMHDLTVNPKNNFRR